MKRNTDLLLAAHDAYDRCAGLRARRERYKRFTYGDQWSDPAEGSNDGSTERDIMLARGYKPLSNNLIRQLVKCIIGRWRSQRDQQPAPLPGSAAERIYRANELDELDCRTLEEFLISGCAIQRISRENRPITGLMTYVDMVSPARFFVNAHTDPRGRDIEMTGMLHSLSPGELLARFGGTPARERALRRLYADTTSSPALPLGEPASDTDTFFSAPGGRCRVIEVWTLECRERIICHDPAKGKITTVSPDCLPRIDAVNRRRVRLGHPALVTRIERRALWRGRYLAPDGTILDERDSPLAHGRHPFVIKLYPLTDGEVHPLVEDVIDQQVYVNRLITLLDRVMLTSAKGALLFPEDQVSDSMTLSNVAEAWAAPDGVIPYHPIPGQPEPHQLVTNATDIGARELLEVQMRLFERVSGVSDALQGRIGTGIQGAQMYDSQVRNALVAVADLLETFNTFIRARNDSLA